VTGGIMDPQHVGSGDAWGLELAMNCGLLQTPTGVVRTKLSVNKFDKAGLELTTVELNPRWTIPVAKDLTFGVGPGIGWVKADGGRNVDMFAWQAGADLDYRIGQLNLGLGALAGHREQDRRRRPRRRRQLAGAGQGRHRVLTRRPRPQGRLRAAFFMALTAACRGRLRRSRRRAARRGPCSGFPAIRLGSESATMPAPAWTWIMPSLTTAVRMAMARSMSP
jgi:hypothetical protein